MKFAFINAEKAHIPVSKLCEALDVSRAGFYAWLARPESERSREDRKLKVLVREAHERNSREGSCPRRSGE